ncbi:hypothetical protein ACWPKO_07060 [Coraliomargarita sp. W4R53]
MQFPRTSRTLKLASLFLFGAMLVGSAVSGEVPAFVKESLYSPNAALVAEVVPTLAADVVILDGGLEQGIRLGMVCRVTRGLQSVGELIIIESRSDHSAGLILDLVDDSTIQAGDIARIKTLQNS